MEPPNTSSISQEDIHTLPEYTQNILPELNNQDLPTLILTSHAHTPSLDPAPDLKIDVRNLPNPPKQIRDA
jgi:RNase adaptor protein for sRNA GlmZ degradation